MSGMKGLMTAEEAMIQAARERVGDRAAVALIEAALPWAQAGAFNPTRDMIKLAFSLLPDPYESTPTFDAALAKIEAIPGFDY